MNTDSSQSQDTIQDQQDTSASTATPVSIQEQLEASPFNPANKATEKKFPVVEIFGPVIQGEGSQAGQQTMFIRFGGCDYRCQKCDSLHAVIPQAIQKHATYMTTAEIMEKLWNAREETGVQWVTFSGGNPCMHQLGGLVDVLRTENWMINVETQGTLWQDWLLNCTLITCSPKSMGMGEKFEKDKFTKFLMKLHSQRPLCIKVVVFSAQDFEFALHIRSIVEDIYRHELTHKYISAIVGGVSYYLSLGNSYPPILDDENDLVDNPMVTMSKVMAPEGAKPLVDTLLHDYRTLSEEVLLDPRLKDFRFLPQLHVLTYGNESER